MPFGVAKNGMRMYLPSWQLQPGSTMKSMNRAASDSYYSNFSSLGTSFLSTMNDQTVSMMQITTQIVSSRIQAEAQEKLKAAESSLSGLDISI